MRRRGGRRAQRVCVSPRWDAAEGQVVASCSLTFIAICGRSGCTAATADLIYFRKAGTHMDRDGAAADLDGDLRRSSLDGREHEHTEHVGEAALFVSGFGHLCAYRTHQTIAEQDAEKCTDQ